ncbi:MAG: relaxase domain-containing protein [Propionibacteriaceae bacterium]|jgi:conjugative relaxase-like TrwC/TraI family protein|nr:relaxase domain-containing protein [Propionibacteriaceae bacterium]
MTVSLHLMSAATGYEYLLKSVVTGDGNRDLSSPLTRYYTEVGTPPGTWTGRGLAGLGMADGDTVTEQHLQCLLGYGLHPLTAEPLGRAYPKYPTLAERIERRVTLLSDTLTPEEREQEVTRITADEQAKPTRHAVAGYELTFSAPKSVSVLWGLADAGTQQIIANAHHEAIAATLDFIERHLATTRTGANRPASATTSSGAVTQVDVTGVSAACFDHYDSRAADPQLHTHVVISNKVMTVEDCVWRSLDGRPIHSGAVAISELHKALLADILTRDLGITWDTRGRAQDRNQAWEIIGVPDDMIAAFSARSVDIDAMTDTLIEDYLQRHGRRPSARTILKLREQATLQTRQPKNIRSLADLTSQWRDRATAMIDTDPIAWANRIINNDRPLILRADDIPLDVIAHLGEQVMTTVGDKRATWQHWNLHAEASRQTMDWRFATATDRETIVDLVTQAAEAASMRLTPAETVTTPARFTRPDGTSRFRPAHATVVTSEALYQAEERLLTLSCDTNGPTISLDTLEVVTSQPGKNGVLLGDDQTDALTAIAVSGRLIDLLVGPAGAGKTTAMNALRQAWEQEHGQGSVVGLAPSATAAQVLGEDLGIQTENTTKWLTDHDTKGLSFTTDQLIIVDEASLAGTFTLDRITNHAASIGAKVLLVGDWTQLTAVDAGGAFHLLVSDRDDAPELFDIHRFHNDWEKTASLALRHGHAEIIDTYQAHDRIHDGTAAQMQDDAYIAWRADLNNQRTSILIADDTATVTALNQKAREDQIRAGNVDPSRHLLLSDASRASVGDWVITRQNDRRLKAGKSGWVRNGDRWTITAIHNDGSVTIRRQDYRHGATVVLPSAYTNEHLCLGYAVTAYRAQGVTVDTAHVIAKPGTTRENLYVALTRGRHANHVYVTTDVSDPLVEEAGGHPKTMNTRAVLTQILHTSGAEQSAHEAERSETDNWESIAQLAAEYRTIAAASRPTLAEQVKASARQGLRRPQRYIVGLIPEPTWPVPPEYAAALAGLRQKIEARAKTVLDQARQTNAPWLHTTGIERPGTALTIAAYRDTYSITSNSPLGPRAAGPAQRIDQARAAKSLKSPAKVKRPELDTENPPSRPRQRPAMSL